MRHIGDRVGIIATDTLYGLVGSAFSKKAVAKIRRLKNRSDTKPFIILISSVRQLKLFGITVDSDLRKKLKKFWPGRYSIIFPCPHRDFFYLHRGTKSLAFRLPAKKSLRVFLRKTGPLVALSANKEGRSPAQNIHEAQHIFGDAIDFYRGRGDLTGEPSKIIKIEGNAIIYIRK